MCPSGPAVEEVLVVFSRNGKTDYDAGEYCGLEQLQCKVEVAY